MGSRAGLEDGFEGAAELGGYFLAHAICRVRESGTLAPLVGHERILVDSGERAFTQLRFEAPDPRDALRNAEQWLDTNPQDVARAVLVHAGELIWLGERHEALFSRIVDFRRPLRSLEVVIPYRPATDAQPFAIHRPKLFEPRGLPEDLSAIPRALFRGVDAHEPGGKTWSRYLDQSV
jgi:hypothetical protein